MSNSNLIVKELKRSINKMDVEKLIEYSDNEAKTRMYLVEPFFEILGYNRGLDDGNFIPEYPADFAGMVGKAVDYAIKFRNKVDFIIEVKKASLKLTDYHLRQLNEYFINTQESKIGILTNGVEYRFYCRNDNNNSGHGLHPTPFFVFDISDVENSSFEGLSIFYMTMVDTKKY